MWQVRGIGGCGLLLDLDEEGIAAGAAGRAFQIDDVAAQSDGAGANDA